ncbi:MAG: acyl-CoA carboxylase subunit epsilon [Streptosporangiaceae bacterium]
MVKGNPTEQEIAALVAVLFARAAPVSAPGAPPVVRSEWSARSRLLRSPLHRGPGAWRASALPR